MPPIVVWEREVRLNEKERQCRFESWSGSTTLERLEVEAREVRIPGVLRKARVLTRWDAT